MSINELSITELKALAFDCIAQRDQLNANLDIIQRRIVELQREAAKQEDKGDEE